MSFVRYIPLNVISLSCNPKWDFVSTCIQKRISLSCNPKWDFVSTQPVSNDTSERSSLDRFNIIQNQMNRLSIHLRQAHSLNYILGKPVRLSPQVVLPLVLNPQCLQILQILRHLLQ
jgi:hypothetical protein